MAEEGWIEAMPVGGGLAFAAGGSWLVTAAPALDHQFCLRINQSFLDAANIDVQTRDAVCGRAVDIGIHKRIGQYGCVCLANTRFGGYRGSEIFYQIRIEAVGPGDCFGEYWIAGLMELNARSTQ